MQKEDVIKFISDEKYSPATSEKIALNINANEEDIPVIEKILEDLVSEGVLIKGKKGKFFKASSLGFVTGIFRGNAKGFGLVIYSGGELFISDEKVNGALNGDRVVAKPISTKKGNRRREGEIIRILNRKQEIIVGIYRQERSYGILAPDDEKLPKEIFVAPEFAHGALNGQKVAAEIIEYESAYTSLQCEIKEILGFPYDFGVDMLSVIKSYGFNTEFPPEVLAELETAKPPLQNEFEDRLDLTGTTVITIDGDDTKDIDDAVSIEKLPLGYRLGVHIADVSYYVRQGSKTDREAFSRGTSVYLADRVVPMLPFKLSNDLCSLNEGELRLTLSVIMDFDENGNIIQAKFFKSYIKSAARMTYRNVRLILERHPQELCEKYKNIVPSLELMYLLYLRLHENTKRRGAIDFNIPEAKAVFDKDGKTIDIVLRENTFANNIIEEFMIAANASVAKYLSDNNVSAIYRIHEKPDEEKLSAALNFVYNLGYMDFYSPADLLAKIKGIPQEAAISTMLLRSMAKARYSNKNLGHYGLMLENYCHFTSPIRRYPDLVCHRALKAFIENDKKMLSFQADFVNEASERCSEREQSAQLCERDALDIKKAEYMEAHIGEEFEGVISSVTGFGFFVMLKNTVEGLVRVESLKDDYYVYDNKMMTLTGERSGRHFNIGEEVLVKLAYASKISRKIDFVLIEGGYENGGKNKNSGAKQKCVSRVFHRRKVRGRH